MADWISFWNGEHAIYVNERHRRLHYDVLARDLAAFVPGSRARVVDYGCGEALAADALAARCGHLILCDAAPAVREKLKARFAGNPAIAVLAPEEVAALPGDSVDLVIANSLVQYLSSEVLDALLAVWRRILSPGGRLLVADVIPPEVSALDDARALLSLAAGHGFLLPALAGLVRTALSPYRKLRAEIGLSVYNEGEMLAVLAAAGFRARRVRPNVGHNQKRMAFLAEPVR